MRCPNRLPLGGATHSLSGVWHPGQRPAAAFHTLSAEGQGSTFTVCLPLAGRHDALAAAAPLIALPGSDGLHHTAN